jgi:predicted adenylyl cyclase CyaB
MARNVEIKARIESVDAFLPLARAVADTEPMDIFQEDTFFNCPSGRLKLRVLSEREGQLIFYQRPDSKGPKTSVYHISATSEPRTLLKTLTLAYGICGRVVKQRTLLLCGQTRLHLDRVEGLGHFLELEVVLTDEQTSEAGIAIANDLLARLDIPPSALVTGAYRDLLAAGASPED